MKHLSAFATHPSAMRYDEGVVQSWFVKWQNKSRDKDVPTRWEQQWWAVAAHYNEIRGLRRYKLQTRPLTEQVCKNENGKWKLPSGQLSCSQSWQTHLRNTLFTKHIPKQYSNQGVHRPSSITCENDVLSPFYSPIAQLNVGIARCPQY